MKKYSAALTVSQNDTTLRTAASKALNPNAKIGVALPDVYGEKIEVPDTLHTPKRGGRLPNNGSDRVCSNAENLITRYSAISQRVCYG
jgi:hypothetical protein